MEPMVDILILICVYTIFATLSIIPLFCMSIIMAPVNSIEFFLFASSCIISYFICYLIEISRKWAEKYYEKHELTSMERYRMDVLILSGIVGFLAMLPRIVMFLEGTEQLIFCYATLICVPAFCSCLYQYFAFQTKTTINLYKQRYLIAVWLVFHAFLLTVNLYKMRESSLPDNLKGLHEVCQIVFSVLSAVSSLEFVMAWRGAVESNDTGEQYRIVSMVNEEIEVEEVVYENEPRIECKVCFLGYSNTHNIPRILKECGHTICENCANELLNRHSREYLMCPLCQMITVVNGSANLLKKNQAALDFVEDLKKQS